MHRLIALVFLGPRPTGLQVRHLDGNKQNNQTENLAYGTQSENELDKVRHGTHSFACRTRCKHGHAFTPENTRVDRKGSRTCRACERLRKAA